jgi:outer membrane biosynthesis protein TonB
MGGLALSLPSQDLSISEQVSTPVQAKKTHVRLQLVAACALLFLLTCGGLVYVKSAQSVVIRGPETLASFPVTAMTEAAPSQSSSSLPEAESRPEAESDSMVRAPISPPVVKATKKRSVVKNKVKPAQLKPVRRAAPASAAAPPKAVVPTVGQSEPQEQVRKFDIRALKSGVSDVVAQIGSCRSATDPSGIAKVSMVFSTSGRVTSAVVSGQPFAGTATGGCIARRFRALRLPAFDGERRTIRKTVVVQ